MSRQMPIVCALPSVSGPVRRYQLFAARKPVVTSEWQNKLPDFVKRLEEALYRCAPNKVSAEHRSFAPCV